MDEMIYHPGAIYHVMFRGNNHQTIFHDYDDYLNFTCYMAYAVEKFHTKCHAFCLMTNHAHLLMQIGTASIDKFSHSVANRYARTFNRKYERTGHVFEHNFAREYVGDSTYLAQITRYIHRNPIKAKMVSELDDYSWSSFTDYALGARFPWLTTSLVLSLYEGPAGLDRFLDFQRTNDDEFLPAWERVSELQAVAIDPAADLNSLVDEAITRHDVSFEELVGPGRTRQLTRTRVWLARRAQASGVASQAEVASLLNRSRQAIFDLLKRH